MTEGNGFIYRTRIRREVGKKLDKGTDRKRFILRLSFKVMGLMQPSCSIATMEH